MRTRVNHGRWLGWLCLSTLAVAAGSCGRSAPPAPTASPPSSATAHADIFTNLALVEVEIEIPRSGMSTLRHTQWGDGERPVTKATVREGGDVYNNVAIHLKGAAGSFRSVDDHPALTLNFDKFVPGQSFHGLHKISLNNSVQDPSFLSEKLCRELCEAAGVPVPRAGHALVKLNGRDLGLYVVLEGANRQFLKRHFNNAKGNLYDGGFVRDVNDSLSVNCGEHPEDHSGLTALLAAERESRRSGSLQPLEQALDVDRFLSMMAMEVILCHWDGYALNKNNWRIFHDLDSNKMVFIPHGLDQTFGTGQHRDFSGIEPPRWEGRIAGAVMKTAEGRRRYRQRVGQLYTNVFKVDQIVARIDEIEANLSPALKNWDSSAASRQEHQATWFKQRIVRRVAALGRQLGAPVTPVKFGSNDRVQLTAWKPSVVRTGDPILSESKDAQGRSILAISAAKGQSTGSWRLRMVLPEGRYRFEGRVRVQGVTVEAGDTRGGAGLRISKGTMPEKLTGTANWTDYSYPFQVEEEDGSEVEFICELKAVQGQAWFDAGSLRVVRVR